MNDENKLVEELVVLLQGGSAHASFEAAVKGLDYTLTGRQHEHLPYTIWQLTEHIRIAQWDMMEFSRDAAHQSPEWPEGYWPAEKGPADEAAWKHALEQIRSGREQFIALLKTGDLYAPFAHGKGQTLLREALQIADHNAYHTAEIIMLRRLFGAWK